MSEGLTLKPGALDLASLRQVAAGAVRLNLDAGDRARVEAGARYVTQLCAGEAAVYGVNTGFGKLARTAVPRDKLAELQQNLVLSHAAGVGEPLPAEAVRLVLALKLGALAQGYSGVRWQLLEHLAALLAHDVLPVMPAQGSVGASGDLAPLAHMAQLVLGFGEADVGGQRKPAEEALAAAGLAPLELAPKEGLALINGTQVATALGLLALFRACDDFAATVVAGALSVDAALGSDVPFDATLNALRGQPGQRQLADVYRDLIAASEIRDSHRACGKVQDPYCLRCQPAVMGPVLETLDNAAATFEREANAVSDNPLVLPDADRVLSGGNFHGAPVGHACDRLAVALTDMASLAERRINLLTDANLSDGLPPFLVAEAGLNSGFMVSQVTAAALVSEAKQLATPASVDSIPTSANQEDHVAMATQAARRLLPLAANARRVAAIELLAAGQGIDFRRPLTSSPALEGYHATVRARVSHYGRDREMAPDIAAATGLIADGAFRPAVAHLLPDVEAPA